jgi:hypothetical protein
MHGEDIAAANDTSLKFVHGKNILFKKNLFLCSYHNIFFRKIKRFFGKIIFIA